MDLKKLHSHYSWVLGCMVLGLLIFSSSCKKDGEINVIPDNTAPYYDEVPTAVIQNYVNRMYIDLIGREPLDDEMDGDVDYLKDNDLSIESRDSVLRKLQWNRDFIEGDSSYSRAYFRRFYDVSKVRLLEGASDGIIRQRQGNARFAAIVDSTNGDSVGYEENMFTWQKYENVLRSDWNYFSDSTGTYDFRDMYFAMIYNGIYDIINMNTFNFINATYDDLFYRFPTEEEYENSFDMIEFNQSGTIFQRSGQNKVDYCNILLDTREFYEGMVRWSYLSLLAREPSTVELSDHMQYFFTDHDLQRVQREIMSTDEYANF